MDPGFLPDGVRLRDAGRAPDGVAGRPGWRRRRRVLPGAGIGWLPDGRCARVGLTSGMSATTDADVLTFTRPERAQSPRTPVEPGALMAWRPAVNAYSCQGHFVVFVELAGLDPDDVVVTPARRTITIRGSRPAPEPGCPRTDLTRLLALEIDHGSFERTVQFPQEIDAAAVTTSYRDGLLRIEAPLAPSAA